MEFDVLRRSYDRFADRYDLVFTTQQRPKALALLAALPSPLPTPTIDLPQRTIDKYTRENCDLSAITRRDPTIVARIWPVAEAFTAITLLDHLTAHFGYQTLIKSVLPE